MASSTIWTRPHALTRGAIGVRGLTWDEEHLRRDLLAAMRGGA